MFEKKNIFYKMVNSKWKKKVLACIEIDMCVKWQPCFNWQIGWCEMKIIINNSNLYDLMFVACIYITYI